MLEKLFPFLGWFRIFSKESLRSDALAGLTVALVLIPQSMAYAQLAGLPAYYGLYAAFLPPMIAALFGSSRQLATGPVAVVSLMTSASLAPLATAGSEGYIAYAILLALMVGIFQFALGVLRLGVVVNFLSHPVVNGFTNAAAIIIATSQLSKMFGVYVDTAEHHYVTVFKVVAAAVNHTHWPTFFMGLGAFAIMYALRWLNPRIPNVLVAVAVTTLISWATGFDHNVRLPLSSVESREATALINRFNEKTNLLDKLTNERTERFKALDEARIKGGSREVLKAEYQIKLITDEIELVKAEAAIARATLRKLLFSAVSGPDGGLRIYPEGKTPAGEKSDGRIWTLRVGNKALKEDGLIFSGGGAVVGEIPKGLPVFSVPKIDIKVMGHLFPFAAIIALLGFMEAISIAKAMAAKTGQRLDPNQELIGQGLANALGAIGKSYPVSGSFSRSAVNLQAGAMSGLSSVFTTAAVLIVLMFLTPLLYHLPQSVLAAVIMMAVIGLINVAGFVHAWKAQWYDGAISIVSFLATLAFAPHLDKGIMIGVALSIGVFLYKNMRPRMASLARAEDDALHCAETYGLKECAYISMVRFEGPLFFANASFLEDKITEILNQKKDLKHLIIVANGINDMDASGEETLSLLIDRVRSAGVDISMSGANEAVMKVMRRTHFPEKIGEDHLYPTMEKAILGVYETSHRNGHEEICPLIRACRIRA